MVAGGRDRVRQRHDGERLVRVPPTHRPLFWLWAMSTLALVAAELAAVTPLPDALIPWLLLFVVPLLAYVGYLLARW